MNVLTELTFDWSQPCGEFPEDSMGRAEHARNLTQFLIQKGQETSYVLNLNAKWGTGKTYFLRRWVAEIELIYPTVYIDAWSSDHSDDPLLTVVSEINNTLRSLLNISKLETALFQGVAKAAKVAVPSAIKALLKGQLKKWTGLTPEELEEIISADELADTGAELVKEAINAHNEASVGVEDIKKSITQWLSSVISQNAREYPLFVFIDELDRCRPTYAIEMLETIKHIFDMKNVVFVVATDKDQLQHSIRAIYGAEFDSHLYLDRFFTRTVTLSNPSRTDFIARKLKDGETFRKFNEDEENFAFLASDEGREADLLKLLTGIADGFNWPLRTVSLWLDRLEAALIISPRRLDITLLGFMMALETDNPDWLRKYSENISIFPTVNDKRDEKIKFSSFRLTTRWSFSMFREEMDMTNMPFPTPKMADVHDSDIDILDYIESRMASLKKPEPEPFKVIQKEFELYSSGRELSAQHYDSPARLHPYPHAAMSIHGYFNHRNNTTLKHYMDICRYSALMS